MENFKSKQKGERKQKAQSISQTRISHFFFHLCVQFSINAEIIIAGNKGVDWVSDEICFLSLSFQ